MLNVIMAFQQQQVFVIHDTSFLYLIEQSHITLVAFPVCLSFIYLHLLYALFSFYGLKIVPTSDLQNKQKRNEM